MSHAFRRTAAPAVLTALLGLALVLPAGPAYAHAGLVASSPADGARLEALPAQVSLTFTEDIEAPAYVVVTGPDEEALTDGDPVVDGSVVAQTLRVGDRPAGAYTLAYRVVSTDGHPVTGELSFSVRAGAPTTVTPSDPAAAASPASPGAVTDTSTPRAATVQSGFWSRHGGQVGLGVLVALGAVVVSGLLLVRRRA